MIYLDNNATTQPTARVVEAMLPYLTKCYFNASTSTAAFTGADKPRCEAAAAMAKLLNAEEPECFTFTSGATESNNWVFSSLAKGRKTGRILVSAVEHASVADPATELSRAGFEVVEVPVDGQGTLRLDALANALTDDTILVSVMGANNETGALQPIAAIGTLVRERSPSALFHTDATQAIGKIPVDLQRDWQEIDLLSFSAHKFHGPKGIGGIYIRPGIPMEPMFRGGGQEAGMRAGTTNTPALAGLAAAANEVFHEVGMERVARLRDSFEADLIAAIQSVVIHSRGINRLPNTSCFSIPGETGEDLVQELAGHGILVGTGSACSSGSIHPPKTVLAIGTDHWVARGTLRISLSALTTASDLAQLVTLIKWLSMEGGTATGIPQPSHQVTPRA